MNKSGMQALRHQRFWVMLSLGFSSGLPLALVGSTLQAWFAQSGVDVVTIGALSLIGLPYIGKFLWAPLLDAWVPPILGRRRGWIVITQLCLIGMLLFLAHLHPKESTMVIGWVALVIAFFSATQDIAMDAYRTDLLPPNARGLGTAFFILAYRLALLVSGGLALIVAEHHGFALIYESMAGLLLGMLILTCVSPAVIDDKRARQTVSVSFHEAFADLFSRDNILLIIAFMMLYKIGNAFALSLMSPFLIQDLGFSLSAVGYAYKIVGFIATLMGAFLGGIALTRCSLYAALLFFGVAQAFSNGLFIILAIIGHHMGWMMSTLFIENFCSGMSTVALEVFIMSLCHRQYTATQFALLSALAATGRVVVGPLAGLMVKSLGWVSFYEWTFLLSFPALIILMALRPTMARTRSELTI